MSVTLVFRRFHDGAWDHWLSDPEHFDENDHPDCRSVQLGVEHMAVAYLVARARGGHPQAPHEDPVHNVIVGTAGESVHGAGDCPRVLTAEEVATASRMMNEICLADLRAGVDLDQLKAACLEVENWLWEEFGPNVLDDHLIPMFERIRAFFGHAAVQGQRVVVTWF